MCISWTIKCLILLMHGAIMKFISHSVLQENGEGIQKLVAFLHSVLLEIFNIIDKLMLRTRE